MAKTPPELDAPQRRIARRTWRDLPAAPPVGDVTAPAPPPPAPDPEVLDITTEPPTEETPTIPMIQPAPVVEISAPPAKRRIGARRAFTILAVVVLLVGGAVAVAAVNDDSDDPSGFPTASAPSGESVQDVVAKLGPSVVHIDTGIGVGSGVVVDESLILTAAHVVAGVDEVTVKDSNGNEFGGRVVARNAEQDLAVVSVDDDGDLPAATIEDEPLEVGQAVVAVGSPFGFQQSVSSGIVSGLDRELETPTGTLTGLIQTDTAINPGNSGGPLADMDGNVAGIATAIATTSGSNSGVGFAVPIAEALAILDEVRAAGGADAPTVPDASGTGPLDQFPTLDEGLEDLLDGFSEGIDEYIPEEQLDSYIAELEELFGISIEELWNEIQGGAGDLGGDLGDLFGDVNPLEEGSEAPSGILDLSGLESDDMSSSSASTTVNGERMEQQTVDIQGPDGSIAIVATRGENAASAFEDFGGDDVDLDGIDAKVKSDDSAAQYGWMIGDDVFVVLIVPEDMSRADVAALANSLGVN